MKIVLARMEDDFRVVRERRTDLGEKPIVERVDKPVAMMWLNDGDEDDVGKAEKWAANNGYRVFTYPATEKDPLGHAKRDLLKPVKPAKRGRYTR